MIDLSAQPGALVGQIRRDAGGVVLFAASASSLLESAGQSLFEPQWWKQQGSLDPTPGGRGGSWFISHGVDQWVLRHYRRGGWVGRFIEDRFFWLGESRVRAFSEWRLIAALQAAGLPVPEPVAARYVRQGVTYRCDLITRRIALTSALSSSLRPAPVPMSVWRSVGATVARLHAHGVDHADLNAHNILLDPAGTVSVVDFDRGRVRAAGPWRQRNLARLRRSLVKVSTGLPEDRFGQAQWREVLLGYGGG